MDKYCPKCGGVLADRFIEVEEGVRQQCQSCGAIHYKNSKPTSSVLAVKESKVLLVKRGIDPFKGWWDIPGGFLESGEHPVDGAKREFLEETGLEIKLTHLLGIWMSKYGPIDIDIMNLCYTAEVVGGIESPSSDAVELKWFELDGLPDKIAFDWSPLAINKLIDWHKFSNS